MSLRNALTRKRYIDCLRLHLLLAECLLKGFLFLLKVLLDLASGIIDHLTNLRTILRCNILH